MTVTERERRRMELVDGSAHRTDLCEQLAMREYELDNIKKENDKLRELVQKLYANLRNRESILELMGMPPSEAAKDEMRTIIDKCSELGIEVVG